MFFRSKIGEVRAHLAAATRVCVLTGAGLSVASGVPPFRGKGGIWDQDEILQYAFPDLLHAHPAHVWSYYERARILTAGCTPNAGHLAIRELANHTKVDLFTQNVDGLHGSTARELHGSLHRYRCLASCCENRYGAYERLLPTPFSSCPTCRSAMRHDVVLFGEKVQHVKTFRASLRAADVILLIGTSGLVTSTQKIALAARFTGKYVVEINPARFTPATLWTNVSIRAPAEDVLPELVA